MGSDPKNDLGAAKRMMGALVRQPPKLHEEMKVGKRRERKKQKEKQKEKNED